VRCAVGAVLLLVRPGTKWTHSFSDRAAIHRYLEDVTDDFGLRPHLRLRHDLLEAKWDPGHRRWLLRTSGGAITCDFLVVATGPLAEPKICRAWPRSLARSSTRSTETTTLT
jgi:cation diffusion facilitator CzcD-associated flavoprotein CzcO